MRILTWLTLGFGAACSFCAYDRKPVLLIVPAMVLLAACLSRGKRLYKAIFVILGILGGLFWFSRFEEVTLQPVYALDGVKQEASICCSSFPEETDYGFRVEGRIALNEKNYPVLCYLDDDKDMEPGKLLNGCFQFRVTAPGGEKHSTYYQGEGIFLLAYQREDITVSEGEPSWRDKTAVLRRQILEILEKALPKDAAMFAKALLLGDTSGLDYETKTNLTVSGIRHIVAVSGLHVSILFSLLHTITLHRRFLSSLLTVPVLLLFAAMAGFTPSVVRACIMTGLMLLAMLLNREYDAIAALSFAGLVLLLVNPLVITSVSYQLSFASVAGIFLFSARIRKWIRERLPKHKISQYLSVSISVTLGATIMTTPLCALYFGTISLAAIVTNLLVLWVVSIIFYGLMGLCLLFGIWNSGALLLGKILTVMIRYVLLTAKVISDFPLSAVYTRSPYIVAWLVFIYLLLGVFLISRKKEPLQLGCCIVLGLCFSLLASKFEPGMDDVRFTMLDVGQGQCLLLQTEGMNFVVDCGGSSDAAASDAAAETLLSQGIFWLDGLILTHYDRDHAGGISGLLSRVDTQLLILPPVYSEENYPAERTLYAWEDIVITAGKTEIHIYASKVPGNDNENSLCILFDTENCDILVTGDRNRAGERSLLQNASIPDVDVLVAGHHGSKYATCEELLTAVQPEIVCISAGRNNLFGHPAPELLERLEKFGCNVYRTDLQGDILIRR